MLRAASELTMHPRHCAALPRTGRRRTISRARIRFRVRIGARRSCGIFHARPVDHARTAHGEAPGPPRAGKPHSARRGEELPGPRSSRLPARHVEPGRVLRHPRTMVADDFRPRHLLLRKVDFSQRLARSPAAKDRQSGSRRQVHGAVLQPAKARAARCRAARWTAIRASPSIR